MWTLGWAVLAGRMLTAWMSGLAIPLCSWSTRSQVSPRSRLRQAPPSSMPNQTSRPSSGSKQIDRMRGRLTPRQNSGISMGSRCQLAPASVERNIAARDGAPVPANTCRGLCGSMAKAHTVMPSAGELRRSKCAPPSVDRQMPASAPAKTRDGSSGSTARARTTPSNSMASFKPRRCQVAPSSTVRRIPWPAVPTNMVPCICRSSLKGSLSTWAVRSADSRSQRKMPRVMPPSTPSDSPVIAALRVDARNSTASAISSGRNVRRMGVALA